MTVLYPPWNPCDPSGSLTVGFAGLSTLHVTLNANGAKVDASQSGIVATTINSVLYVGALNWSSKVNLNNQNNTQSVAFAIAASSLDGTKQLSFNVTERVTFNASDPLNPVSGTSEIVAATCPS